MAKQGKTTAHSSKADDVREQLRQLPAEQLADIVMTFFDALDEKHRLEFMNLLPSAPEAEMESELPYSDDDEFLDGVEEFCERVLNDEFVEYGSGYDPEEGEYHGFGDDSWIDEMDELFEDADLHFLARHYEASMKACQQLFACLEFEWFHFTTSDPQGALRTDLEHARKRYFQSLCALYTGEELAERIIEGLGKYRYISSEYPDIGTLFPDNADLIQLLENSLIKIPSTDREASSFLDLPAESLKQIYERFRNLDELEQFAQQHGKRHPWCYENLVQAHAGQKNWEKTAFWAEEGLNLKDSKNTARHALLADYKTRAAQHLGNPEMALSACWDAFETQATVERYVELRRTAKAQGKWDEYYPRLIQRLTHDISGNSVLVGHLYDNRLLVEALLVEGRYEEAIEKATQRNIGGFWDNKENAPKSIVDFFLYSISRAVDKGSLAERSPEITAHLAKSAGFIAHVKEELFAAPLSDANRDKQIEWIVQLLTAQIDRIVGGQMRDIYDRAAHEAKLVYEVYCAQGRSDNAQQYIRELHKTRYPRHSSFRAELRNLQLNAEKTQGAKK